MRTRRRAGGFTLIEVLVALALMAIGLIGILALQRGSTNASGYSRRATEAAILGEDKLEELRTVAIATAISDSDRIDASGVANPDGLFERQWTLVPDGTGTLVTITVAVTWQENDGGHTITLRTLRNLQ